MNVNCPNCGAPLVGGRCEYCGTVSPEAEERIQAIRRHMDEWNWLTSFSNLLSCDPYRCIPQDTQRKE